MMHWSLSRSNEYCSCDNTATPLPCDAAKSCPISNVYAAFPDTVSVKALMLPVLPDVVCANEYSPKAFSDEHRKKQASAERHEDAYMLQEVFSDGPYGNSFVRLVDVSPEGRTRRMIPLGRWMQAGLHTCESVFFRLKLRIVAFFPGFSASEPDFFLMQNCSKRFNTDRANNLFFDKIFPKFFQRPSLKRAAQKVGRTFGSFGNERLVVFGKLRRSAGTRLWFQRLKAAFIKFCNNCTDMMFGVMDQFCDSRHFIALFGSQDHLCPPDFDTICTAAKDLLNSSAFIHFKFAYVETHNLPPCKSLIVSLRNIGINIVKNLN